MDNENNKPSFLAYPVLLVIAVILLIGVFKVLYWAGETQDDIVIPDTIQTEQSSPSQFVASPQLEDSALLIQEVGQETEFETETGQGSSLIIKKTLYCNVWHTECDVMGDEYWVKDEISNPKGIKSKEGHRKDHCGAIDSWFVYLDEYGKPYSMLEMKAGSTNNLIPLPAIFYTDETYTELRDPATIEVGERIYWTTENKGQCWHHTGVTRLDIPNFEFIVDGESYYHEF